MPMLSDKPLRGRNEPEAVRRLLVGLIDNIPVMLCIWDEALQRFRFNQHLCDVLGWTEADADCDFLAKIYPDREYRQGVIDYMNSLEAGWRDLIMTAKDGSTVDTSWANVRLPDGSRIGIGIDIGQRKAAEDALRDANRRKDLFLATLAHELRNPLAAVRNSIESLRLASNGDAALEPALNRIERQSTHLVRLVDQLLDVSRISRGRIELQRERLDLATAVLGAVEANQPLIDAASQALSVHMPEEPLIVHADPVRMTQVFANLLNNAAKFTEPGQAIRISGRREGANAVVRVRDNGIGISPDALPHVFETFAQTKSLGADPGGLGVGLSLVRGFVEMHGGHLDVHSEGIGLGTEITVCLPASEPSGAQTSVANPEMDAGELPAVRVLVVDDDRDAADSMAEVLRLLGAEARAVYDGPAALEVLEDAPAGVVLLDIGMPGMDGYAVARAIQQTPARNRLKLIALTGWGDRDSRDRVREAGFDHHLIKPADIATLRALLSDVDRSAAAAESGRVP